MTNRMNTLWRLLWLLVLVSLTSAYAQPPQFGGMRGGQNNDESIELVSTYDGDGDGVLNAAERAAALAGLGRTVSATPAGEAGPQVSPSDVEIFSADNELYDPYAIRTLFLELPMDNWENELEAFYNTDVHLLGTLEVDGVTYEDVGVRFRGNSSYSSVSTGLKRPLRLKVDLVNDDQRLLGYRTLNLINAASDPSSLRTVLYSMIGQDYMAIPQVGLVRLVVNGESWGIYQNQQHYNKDFLADFFGETEGVRWKVSGSPNGQGGMSYLGDEADVYREIYEIDNKDRQSSWDALINLFRTLNETPDDQLVAALEPILDIDGVLRFLALEVALVNSDGFYARASDYYIYLDESGKFHVIPHDFNEALGAQSFGGGSMGGARGGMGGERGGPDAPSQRTATPVMPPNFRGGGLPANQQQGVGFPGMAAAGGASLDPLTGLSDASKPLRSKLLAIPELREKYLGYVRDIAETWLDWENLGPIVTELNAAIAPDFATDTRALFSLARFEAAPDDIKAFVAERRAFLLAAIPEE